MPDEPISGTILVIDDEKGIRDSLQLVLEYEGYPVQKAVTGQEGLDAVEMSEPHVILLDVKMPGLDGMEVLERLNPIETGQVVIMISGHADIATAVEATRMGAFDFLEKPLDQEKVLLTVRNGMARAMLERQNRLLRNQVEERFTLVTVGKAMESVLDQVARVAATDTRVLISGENGTGKELIARRIHALSGREAFPFIPVNCAAIPGELIESELFGHVKGAFTGAYANKVGKFELASGGTLFLDEVGDMSLPAQAKVLRALEEGVVEQVGGDRAIRVDTRVVAATNKDLEYEIAQGNFRQDLLYRLRVVPLHIPPLRERRSDIMPLCEHFLAYYCATSKRQLTLPFGEIRVMLEEYPWPGNVRELRNAMERLVIMSEDDTISTADVEGVLGPVSGSPVGEGPDDSEVTRDLPKGIEGLARMMEDEPDLGRFRDEAEKIYLLRVLEEHRWNVKATADFLGIQRSNLYRKLVKHGIERGDILEQ